MTKKPYNEQIKSARKASGLTQKEVAEKAGITLNQVQKIEARDRFPAYKTLLKICQALNTSITIEPGHPDLKPPGSKG